MLEILGMFAETICVEHMSARCRCDITRSRYVRVAYCTLAVRSGISGFYMYETQDRERSRSCIELTAVITQDYEFYT